MLSIILIVSFFGYAFAHGPYEHPKKMFRVENAKVEMDPKVSMFVSTSEFIEDKQKVTVSWSGVDAPQITDLIALYIPANSDPRRVVPVQYMNCSLMSNTYLNIGSGSASFELLNMRWSMGFKLVRGGYKKPTVVAEAPAIENRISKAPTGGHLAVHKDAKSVVLQWVSAEAGPQFVEFGSNPGIGSGTVKVLQQADLRNFLRAPPGRPSRALLADAGRGGGEGRVFPGEHGGARSWPCEGTHATMDSTDAAAEHCCGVAVVAVDEGGQRLELGGGGAYMFRASSFRDTYKSSDMCGYPANSAGWMDPGHIHTVVMSYKLLRPGQRYYYRYGSEEGGWSEQHSFIAPVPPGLSGHQSSHGAHSPGVPGRDAASQPFTFLAFNDVAMTYPLLFNDFWAGGLHFNENYGQNSSLLADYLSTGAEQNAQLALLIGDLAYALGFAADWDVFGSQFEAAFTQWPMAVAPGNHERDYPRTGDAFENTAHDSGGECNVPYMWRWYNAANIQRNPFRSYYSFNMGPIHFLLIDSESPGGPETEQGRFVAADLAAVDRAVTPWVVASMHRMMMAPATWRRKHVGDLDNIERLMAEYEHLFLMYGVDLVIQGHEHAYARTCPMKHGACVGSLQSEGLRSAERSSHRLLRSFSSSGSSSSGSGSSKSAAVSADQGAVQGCSGGQCLSEECGEMYVSPAGPTYVLAGHAGAGFTHGFPDPLPEWVASGIQFVNGYVKVTADEHRLKVRSIGLRPRDVKSGTGGSTRPSEGGAGAVGVSETDPRQPGIESFVMDCVDLVR